MARTYGALVLAGGQARRMGGQNKALLELDRQTFLARLEKSLECFEERLLSANDPALAVGTTFRPIPDRIPGRGPLEGLAAALAACESDALLVVPCDVPLFPAGLAQALVEAAQDQESLICRDRAGRLHPLCGVYAKSCLSVSDRLLAQGHFRALCLHEMVRGGVLSLENTPFPDRVLTNVNTRADLEALKNGQSPS